MNNKGRLQKLEDQVPAGKRPVFRTVTRNDEGQYFLEKPWAEDPLTEAQLEEIRESCDILLVIHYTQNWGK